MRTLTPALLNGATLDLIPARLMRARSAEIQRLLATHDWLLRQKSDGRFLACANLCAGRSTWRLLARGSPRRWQAEAEALVRRARSTGRVERELVRHRRAVDAFDHVVGADYAQRTGLVRFVEPSRLALGGYDRYRRPLWLSAPAARAWQRMRGAAARDGVALEAISGFRSRDYQLGIFRRKLARGQSLDEILAVNAAPGYSEHHSGRAVDVGTPGEPAAEASFEDTPAFAWLEKHAAAFGFAMSYPRGNPHGIAYEPWHWMWHPARTPASGA